MSGSGAHRPLLEAALADPAQAVDRLSSLPPAELDSGLRELARARGEAVLPLVTALAARGSGPSRRIAKRTLYRLAQAGITPPRPEARPVIERRPDRPSRAWISGIDGSGARAAWIVFEGGYGGLSLCSVIISDVEGVVEVAGGDITKKRLETELASLRASQKLPWIDLPPAAVMARVVDALAIHARRGTEPPAGFARWRRLFAEAAGTTDTMAAEADPALVERGAELFELAELRGWFLEPEPVQGDAVKLMEARSSRLVVSDQVKTEREAAIVSAVVEREVAGEARARWAHRLREMALVFERTARADAATLARATASRLLDQTWSAAQIPFARGLAHRALEVASEIASGRLSPRDLSRQPGDRDR